MERNLASAAGHVTGAYMDYLAARAAGGAALVFTESSYIRADGKARPLQMGVHEDACVGPLRELASRIHRHGALLGVELNHGGRTAQTAVNGVRCVAPSPVPCAVAGGEIPHQLSGQEVRDLIRAYAVAARRCQEAGVDVVMLHGAHGYLIHQFMSPRTNLRDDEWADPSRFLAEVIGAVRDEVPNATIGMRVSAFEGPPDGLDADRTLQIVARAPLDRLDFLDISAGSYEAGEWIVQPGEWEEGVLGRHARRYRRFGLPVSVVGRIAEPETAERLLREREADLVSVGRALHADPRWAEGALRRGRARPARPCISSNECIDTLFTGSPVPCTVNPSAAHPGRPARSGVSLSGLRVVVVGAGPAGMEAARSSAARGARVTLLEREDAIGGAVRLSAGLRTYPRFGRIIDWYVGELRDRRVDVRTGIVATAGAIAALEPDAVLIATGARGVVPELPGTGSRRVHALRHWLRDGAPDLGDDRHIVWGADREGVAVADDLLARGKQVLLVGQQAALAPDLGRRAKILMVPRLTDHPSVELMLETELTDVTDDGLTIRRERQTTTIRATGPILVSQGTAPVAEVATTMGAAGHSRALHVIGDAAGKGSGIRAAIGSGADAVRRLQSDVTPARH